MEKKVCATQIFLWLNFYFITNLIAFNRICTWAHIIFRPSYFMRIFVCCIWIRQILESVVFVSVRFYVFALINMVLINLYTNKCDSTKMMKWFVYPEIRTPYSTHESKVNLLFIQFVSQFNAENQNRHEHTNRLKLIAIRNETKKPLPSLYIENMLLLVSNQINYCWLVTAEYDYDELRLSHSEIKL